MGSCPRCGGKLDHHEDVVRKSAWRLDNGVLECRRFTTVATYSSCSGDASRTGCGFCEIIDFRQQEAPVQHFTPINFN